MLPPAVFTFPLVMKDFSGFGSFCNLVSRAGATIPILRNVLPFYHILSLAEAYIVSKYKDDLPLIY